ncbi:MAG: rod shape-determining protein RodA [Deltaproteobacteria bacterium]|nr:rod shape-determining protein RodA [Deltaproteobacteria bacterium]
MFDRRLVKHFDWVLLVMMVVLCVVGLANLYSTTVLSMGKTIFYKQLMWFTIGFAIVFLSLLFNYHTLEQFALPLYGVTLLLLAATLVIGPTVSGSKRWLVLGPMTVQPSELAKLTLIIVLARIFYRKDLHESLGFRDLILPVCVMGAPALLILKEPDLGTAIMFFFVGGSIVLFIRVRWQVVAAFAGILLTSLPFVWKMLKQYQKSRILTFFNPDWDPLGAGYHVTQSKIAVGSGRMAGKGFLSSTQSNLNFLPEHHTDFAFSVLAEEWGFLGSVLVILLYLALIAWGLRVGRRSKDTFGALLTVGIVAMIFWPMVINIGMVTGIMPVVGIPLPLISYGGSNAVTTLFALGLLMNISMRRFLFK